MGMTPKYNPHRLVQKRKASLQQRFERALLLVLNELGMELVKYARENRTYTDRTGNLTNSMGYVILRRGSQVAHGGEQGNGEGQKAALDLYYKLALGTKYDYTLIIVAGMEYAAYVEAKGYNVLMPVQLKANTEFASRMKELVVKYDAKLKQMLNQ